MAIDTMWYVDWKVDVDGSKINEPINGETHVVADNVFYTDGIPDAFCKVTINSPANMGEIKSYQAITANTMYKVDYGSGRVQVHSDLEGAVVSVNYQSRGVARLNSSRIYMDGNTATSLQDTVETIETNITTGDTNFTNHVAGTANKHGTNEIDNDSSVTGASATSALNALKSQMDTLVVGASNTAIGVFSMSGTGTNTITATFATLTYFTGLKVRLMTAGTNTSSATLNINSLGVKTIKYKDRAGTKYSLIGGELPAIADLEYDGTDFLLLNGAVSTYDAEATVTQDITSLASSTLEAPFNTAYLRGNTTNGYDDNTKLLMYFEGTDGSTVFKDQAGKTVVASGNAQIDTAQKRWGTSSGYFDGSMDYLTVTDANNDFDLGTGDFAIELWIRPNSIGTAQYLFDFRLTGNVELAPAIVLYETGVLKMVIVNMNPIIGTRVLSAGVWYHVALCRASGITKMYLNGVQEGSSYTDVNNYIAVPSIRIGGFSGSSSSGGFNGWIDSFRISNVARYTTNFVPQGLNVLSSDKMRVVSCGKNLWNPLSSNGNISNWSILANSYNWIAIKVKPNTTYTISGTYVSDGYICVVPGNVYTTSNFILHITSYPNTVHTVSVTSSSDGYINFGAFSATGNLSKYISNMQLELGSTATAYEPYRETSTIVPVVLNSTSSISYDKFDCLTGIHTKNVSDVISLSGNAYTWTIWGTDFLGHKFVTSPIGSLPNKYAVSNNALAFKYNDKKLVYNGSASAGDTFLDYTDGKVGLAIFDIDSGWDESWNYLTSFTGLTWGGLIKAYLNGWKLTTSNIDVASCVWTGIASGTVKNGGSSDYTFVTTNIDTGYTPYRILYQLATPVITNYYSNVMTAYPSGTIITESFISDYTFYDGNVVPNDLTRPISSLSYVNIVNKSNGLLTSVALSTCTVASLGVSFTSTAISEDDLVDYGYLTVGLSSQPSLTYKTTNNLAGTITGLASQTKELDKKIEQLTTFEKSRIRTASLVIGSVSSTTSFIAFVAPVACVLSRVLLATQNAITASNTDYWTILLQDKGADGSATNTIVSKTTKVTGGAGLAAYDAYDLGELDDTHKILSQGDVVLLTLTKSASATAFAQAFASIEYIAL